MQTRKNNKKKKKKLYQYQMYNCDAIPMTYNWPFSTKTTKKCKKNNIVLLSRKQEPLGGIIAADKLIVPSYWSPRC